MRPYRAQSEVQKHTIPLPSSKVLFEPVPGAPQSTNSFPVTAALSPDGRFLALLNNGRGAAESGYRQSIAILNLESNQLVDYPDPRLKVGARQTYFLGLAFGSEGKKLYASVASLTDPTGQQPMGFEPAPTCGDPLAAVYTISSGAPTVLLPG